jgi:hypothetical protein
LNSHHFFFLTLTDTNTNTNISKSTTNKKYWRSRLVSGIIGRALPDARHEVCGTSKMATFASALSAYTNLKVEDLLKLQYVQQPSLEEFIQALAAS